MSKYIPKYQAETYLKFLNCKNNFTMNLSPAFNSRVEIYIIYYVNRGSFQQSFADSIIGSCLEECIDKFVEKNKLNNFYEIEMMKKQASLEKEFSKVLQDNRSDLYEKS